MNCSLSEAAVSDALTLAEMNKQLIEDEQSPNPMNLEQLERRMVTFLNEGWKADFIMQSDVIVGYILYRKRRNEYFPDRTEVYIRQYFIKREYRRSGIGRAGIQLACKERFQKESEIIIDVSETNPAGYKFWEAIGFKPYYTNMRRANE